MRVTAFSLTAAAALSCVAALAMPPYANELMLPAGGAAAYKTSDTKPALPHIARGQFLGVACANVEHAATDAVRVVILLAEGEPTEGINGVLATEQTITGGMVHVRVPDFTELAQHTVHVKVYVAGRHGLRTCDAGKVRIV